MVDPFSSNNLFRFDYNRALATNKEKEVGILNVYLLILTNFDNNLAIRLTVFS